MSKKKQENLFERYNRPEDAVRCPNGKANLRKLMDAYVRAATTLYGSISRDAFVELFEILNSIQTSSDEIYQLLLPLVLKQRQYCFYEDRIVHACFIGNFSHADILSDRQKGKPRYIPETDEFLIYMFEDSNDNQYWREVHRYMVDVFGHRKATTEAYHELMEYVTFGNGFSELGPILDRHDLVFDDQKQVEAFFERIAVASNNTRTWENNGHTPVELHAIMKECNQNVIPFPKIRRHEIGRNDPCPCGSGKKYKKCCALIDEAQTAQLSSDECRLFYETWYGLLGYVNERKGVVKSRIRAKYPNPVDDMKIHKVREALWNDPYLIDEYLNATELPQEKIDIVKLWRTNHIKGDFFIFEYTPEYAVVLGSNAKGEDRLYGIKGISTSVANAMHERLPLHVETVLLPFKNKIVYDCFIGTNSIGFGDGAIAMLRGICDKARRHGIITSLD
jgi:hypothetical protein